LTDGINEREQSDEMKDRE